MYNKLFTKILDSSVWLEPDSTRIVWFTFLAAMDQDGFAQFASPANLAHRARVSLEHAAIAITALESPDENSSDKDHEGRRIERVPGGWIILNADKYQALVTRAISRERTKERVRKYRERKAAVTLSNAASRSGNGRVTPSDTDTDAHTDKHKIKSVSPETAIAASVPAVMIFPTVGNKGRTWELTQAAIDGWAEMYPSLDVLDQCRHAKAWVESKPANRKTPGGMPGFLVAWFNRTVNRSPQWNRPIGDSPALVTGTTKVGRGLLAAKAAMDRAGNS